MPRASKIPSDFQVTDDHRRYAAGKWTLLFLPDVMLSDFQHCFDEELGGNGYAHKNWDATFKRYMRESSPSGTMHKPTHWEARCEQAKRYKSISASDSLPDTRPAGQDGGDKCETRNRPSTWTPTPTGEKALKDIRALLEPYADLLK